MLDQTDGEDCGQTENEREEASRGKQERDDRSAVEDRFPKEPFACKRRQGGQKRAFTNAKEQCKANEFAPPLTNDGNGRPD